MASAVPAALIRLVASRYALGWMLAAAPATTRGTAVISPQRIAPLLSRGDSARAVDHGG
jgi:hypothetical protein